jgi:hypothetical protein
VLSLQRSFQFNLNAFFVHSARQIRHRSSRERNSRYRAFVGPLWPLRLCQHQLREPELQSTRPDTARFKLVLKELNLDPHLSLL